MSEDGRSFPEALSDAYDQAMKASPELADVLETYLQSNPQADTDKVKHHLLELHKEYLECLSEEERENPPPLPKGVFLSQLAKIVPLDDLIPLILLQGKDNKEC